MTTPLSQAMRAAVAQAITDYRLAQHREVSHAELAKAAGISPGTFSSRMRGQTQWSLDDLDCLAPVLGLSLDELWATVMERRRALLMADPDVREWVEQTAQAARRSRSATSA